MQQAIIIIPAYQPNGSLLRLVRNLRAVGFRVIAVDDGAGRTTRISFRRRSRRVA